MVKSIYEEVTTFNGRLALIYWMIHRDRGHCLVQPCFRDRFGPFYVRSSTACINAVCHTLADIIMKHSSFLIEFSYWLHSYMWFQEFTTSIFDLIIWIYGEIQFTSNVMQDKREKRMLISIYWPKAFIFENALIYRTHLCRFSYRRFAEHT